MGADKAVAPQWTVAIPFARAALETIRSNYSLNYLESVSRVSCRNIRSFIRQSAFSGRMRIRSNLVPPQFPRPPPEAQPLLQFPVSLFPTVFRSRSLVTGAVAGGRVGVPSTAPLRGEPCGEAGSALTLPFPRIMMPGQRRRRTNGFIVAAIPAGSGEVPFPE